MKSNTLRSHRPVSPRLLRIVAASWLVTGWSPAGSTNGRYAAEIFSLDEQVAGDRVAHLPAEFDRATVQQRRLRRHQNTLYNVIDGHAIVEGDIVLGPVDADGRLEPHVTRRGLAVDRVGGRWPFGTLPYTFDSRLSPTLKASVEAALQHWTDLTGIRPVERTPDNADAWPDYVHFEQSQGCASYVGRIGGQQAIWVAAQCTVGSIVHEIGHALGLYHEHTRPDRDNFVQVHWDEIVSGREVNFRIIERDVAAFGPYDYGSIMHYGPFFFSATGRRTVEAPVGIDIGQRSALSPGDIDAVNTLYATDLSLEVSPTYIDQRVELAVSVTNQGPMGARELVFDADLEGTGEWLAISDDSPWDCTSTLDTLHCSVDRLAAGDVSRFVLEASVDVDSTHALDAVLASRTLDTAPLNNAVLMRRDARDGADAPVTAEPPSAPAAATPPTDPATDPPTDPPTDPAAPALAAANDDGGAGSAGLAGSLCIAIAGALRRRRPRRLPG